MQPIQLQLTVTIAPDSWTTVVNTLVKAVQEAARSVASSGPFAASSPSDPFQRKMTPQEASRHANFGGQKPPDDMGLLVDTRQVVKMLGVSPRKLWQMYNSGEMPEPARIGRAVRWGYEELRAWVNAGCPPQSKWTWPL